MDLAARWKLPSFSGDWITNRFCTCSQESSQELRGVYVLFLFRFTSTPMIYMWLGTAQRTSGGIRRQQRLKHN